MEPGGELPPGSLLLADDRAGVLCCSLALYSLMRKRNALFAARVAFVAILLGLAGMSTRAQDAAWQKEISEFREKRAAGLPITEIRVDAPSLENVFVASLQALGEEPKPMPFPGRHHHGNLRGR